MGSVAPPHTQTLPTGTHTVTHARASANDYIFLIHLLLSCSLCATAGLYMCVSYIHKYIHVHVMCNIYIYIYKHWEQCQRTGCPSPISKAQATSAEGQEFVSQLTQTNDS